MRRVLLIVAGIVLFVATPASAQVEPKVYVCKYVGTPGVDEELQSGQNPIAVAVASLPDGVGEVGDEFADAQGRSVVVGVVPMEPEPECPSPTTTTTSTSTTSTTSTSVQTSSTSTSNPLDADHPTLPVDSTTTAAPTVVPGAELPRTGGGVGWQTLAAGAAMLIGAALVPIRRRL